MPQGLPASFQPIGEEQNTGLPESFQPVAEEPGIMSRAWHAISDPLTDAPSRFAKSIGDYIDQPVNRDDSYLSGVAARAKGFTAGALEGVGNLVSGLTSPISLATLGLGGTEYAAGKAGLQSVARLANIGTKVASAPIALHGASQIYSGNTLGEKAQGLAELAGGTAGMLHAPSPVKSVGAGATEAATEQAGKTVKPPVATAAEHPEIAPGVVDPYAKYRETPVGTTYKVAPENFNRKKMTDAIKLGFDVLGLDDNGRVIVKKVRESPKAQLPTPPEVDANILADVANLPRTLMASEDMSAPLRQGLGMIHKKEFWQNIPTMVKAFGSEDFYKSAMEGITSDPLFQKRITAGGKLRPSFAEESGLQLTNLSNMASREESMMSQLAEKIPGVRPSNRAYTLFLNKLRADSFKQMVSDYSAFSGINMKNNLSLAKDLATVINTSTGRGSLGALEPAAKALSTVFFSPRLMASRLQMLNPMYYVGLNPIARKEALKSLFAVAGATSTFTGLMKMAGADVESDPASSDFGKPKFGNTRLDPYGGFQQYIVAAQRLLPKIDLTSVGLGTIGGQMKSTTTGKEYSLDDAGFGRSDRMDVLLRFLRSKTNPIINFGWGLLAGQKELSGKPMNLSTPNPFENSLAQRFLPMLSQDIYDLVKDESTPAHEKAMAAFLASVGMGSQTYGNER